ncbi:hypothetical protein [Paenibacillus chitinolyticus]
MSMQDGTTDIYMVGSLVEEMLLTSPYGENTKIEIHNSDGIWYVTRDHK